MIKVEIGVMYKDWEGDTTVWPEDLSAWAESNDVQFILSSLLTRAQKHGLEITGIRTSKETE